MADTADIPENVLFIPATEWEAFSNEQAEENIVQAMSDPRALSVSKSNFSRADVVNAFQQAFEAVGGTTRLALYAHTHYPDFVKLYSRLLPSQASSALGESNKLIIEHRLPRSALDE